MSTKSQPEIRRSVAYAGMAVLSLVTGGAVVAAGYVPTRALAGADAFPAVVVGVGIALLAALAGLVPPLVTLHRPSRDRLAAMMTGMAVRFLLTLGLLIPVLVSGWLRQVPLVLWVAIGYVVLLGVDTAGLAWLNARMTRACS